MCPLLFESCDGRLEFCNVERSSSSADLIRCGSRDLLEWLVGSSADRDALKEETLEDLSSCALHLEPAKLLIVVGLPPTTALAAAGSGALDDFFFLGFSMVIGKSGWLNCASVFFLDRRIADGASGWSMADIARDRPTCRSGPVAQKTQVSGEYGARLQVMLCK